MSLESLAITTTNYLLDVTDGTTQTLQITDGLTLDLTLGVMGLQGPMGPQGPGDMEKSVYDTDNDGIVDAAETAPWTGISGKPATFPPDLHSHAIADVTGLQTALDGKEPADGTILKDADIGVTVQAYDADLTTWAGKTAPSGTVVGTTDTQTLSGKTITATKEVHAVISASNIDLSTGNVFSKTITGNTTFTLSNVPVSDIVISFFLELTNAGAYTITLWSGVKWQGGVAPILTAAGLDILGFYTRDGGTTWRAVLVSKDNK